MAAAPGPPGQDPLFFAEEFTARRRRFIPVNVKIAQIARDPAYKEYNFPFITGEPLAGSGQARDYALMFEEARNAAFTLPPAGYAPTTRFEAMSYEVYRIEAAPRAAAAGLSRLEEVRLAFVDSLMNGELVNLSMLKTTPKSPIGVGPFAVPPPKTVLPLAAIESSRTVFQQASRFPTAAERVAHYKYPDFFVARFLANFILNPPPLPPPSLGETPIIHFNLVSLFMAVVGFMKMIETWIDEATNAVSPIQTLLETLYKRIYNELIIYGEEQASVGVNNNIAELGRLLVQKLVEAADQAVQAAATRAPPIPAGTLGFEQLLDTAVEGQRRLHVNDFMPRAPGLPFAGLDPAIQAVILDPATGNVADLGQTIIVDVSPGTRIRAAVEDLLNVVLDVNGRITTLPNRLPPDNTKGYLTRDFVDYLKRIARPNPAPATTSCEMVMFKDDAGTPTSGVVIDMLPFTQSISPGNFAVPRDPEYVSRLKIVKNVAALYPAFGCGTEKELQAKNIMPNLPEVRRSEAPTIEDAYKVLSSVTGSPLDRYLEFVRFIYIFFDHIPEVQPVVSALLTPLVAMYNGIIRRGVVNQQPDNGPLLLASHHSTPEEIGRDTTFAHAAIAFGRDSTREEAARAVLRMFRYHRRAFAAIISLLMGGSDDDTVVGFFAPATTDDDILEALLAIDVPDGRSDKIGAEAIYDASGIIQFNLPSLGSAHMVLPAILGIPSVSVLSRVYDLTARWFKSAKEYDEAVKEINNNPETRAEYARLSAGGHAYTTAGRGGILPPSGVQIIERPGVPGGSYIDPYLSQPTTDLESNYDYTLPHSWAELLYPAFVSHAIVERELLREIADKTMVRSCLQTRDYSISFPSIFEIAGGFVSVQGIDVDSEPGIFSAIFEFPANIYQVDLPTGATVGVQSTDALTFFPGVPTPPAAASAGANSYRLTRYDDSRRNDSPDEYEPKTHGSIEYRLVDAIDIRNYALGVTAKSLRHLTLKSNPNAPVPLLQNRTPYVWTSTPLWISDPAAIPVATGAPPAVPVMKFFDPVSNLALFFPALGDIEVFLSSFFDWKLQLFVLSALKKFLRGRSALNPIAVKIDAALGKLDPSVQKSLREDEIDEGAVFAYNRDNTIGGLAITTGGRLPFTGFRNLIFNIVGPTASGNLSEILTMPSMIESFNLTNDIKQFYKTQEPTPARGALTYDIDVDNYLRLLDARSGAVTSVAEAQDQAQQRRTQEAEAKRELDIAKLIEISAPRLVDPYSILINEIVTRALYPTGARS